MAKVKTLPWLQSHVETCGEKALGKKAADGRGETGGKFGGTSWAKMVTSSPNFLTKWMMDVDSDHITTNSAGF